MPENEKIGVGITTYNSEGYFKTLYDSLPLDKIDELVVVNGGDRYEGKYECDWIQHNKNRYPSVCRNDCITFLLNKQCQHIFLIEDDMIIKSPNIFNEYINASKITGLNYFCFASISVDAGAAHERTPKLKVNYGNLLEVYFYNNTCNEFTYHHRSCFEKTGLYDGNMRELFDADMVYRQTLKHPNISPFWWFSDLGNSDDLIKNNPDAHSRLQTDRPDGSREQTIVGTMQYFKNKHSLAVNEIPIKTELEVVDHLKKIKP